MAARKITATRGRRPTMTLAQYRRIVEVKRIRESAPTDKELARELGLPIYTVANAMRGRVRRFDAAIAAERSR
jgi:hypothetical protein